MNYKHLIPTAIVFVLLGGGIIYEYVQISELTERVESIATNLASTNNTLTQSINQISENITNLRSDTTGLSNTLTNTQQNIEDVKTQVGGVEQTVGSISGAVGTLQKLVETDPELLKKYSRVFFLNENYTPAHLQNIPDVYAYSSLRTEQFTSEAWPFLQNLLETAKYNGVTFYVKSAYRSFAEQEMLKSAYTVIYGAGTANSFSADQGYSEHQLGTTVDFVAQGFQGKLDGFDTTDAYSWLLGNAYRFGFVLSYPKGNGYYVYEPWHWRFVGIKLATELHNRNITFYNMDQREIDEYLVNLFDTK